MSAYLLTVSALAFLAAYLLWAAERRADWNRDVDQAVDLTREEA